MTRAVPMSDRCFSEEAGEGSEGEEDEEDEGRASTYLGVVCLPALSMAGSIEPFALEAA